MSRVVFVRSPFNYDIDEVSRETGLYCDDPSLADQSQAEECDINVIVQRFGLTGEIPGTLITPMQGDFTEVTDYRSALEMLMEAQEAFMTLPAKVRAQFENDPHQFLEFASDPSNLDEMKAMGLGRVESPRQAPILVEVVPQVPPEPKSE